MTERVTKSVVVVARRDPAEAMRVASGITVFGHHVTLVFAHGILEITSEVEKNAELLELAEVKPYSLFDDPEVPNLDEPGFKTLLGKSNFVVNV